jgi:hypothetical protein
MISPATVPSIQTCGGQKYDVRGAAAGTVRHGLGMVDLVESPFARLPGLLFATAGVLAWWRRKRVNDLALA